MAPIKDSDLFLINQEDKTYKISANELAEYVEGEIQLPESLFKFVGNLYFDENGDAWEGRKWYCGIPTTCRVFKR